MNSSSLLKLLAVVLALLGLAVTPAVADQHEQQQQTPPVDQQQPPEQQPPPEQPDGTGGAGADGTTDEGGDENEAAPLSGKEPTQEEIDRFNSQCRSKDSEPSHNDKKFCDDFKQKFGEPGATTSSKAKPTQEEIDRYNRYCRSKDSEPSHNDKKFCDDFKQKYPDYFKGDTATTTPTDTGEPQDTKKEDEPDSGPLAFTGLDLWQLLLIGVVLVAGGLGARHLLRQKEAGA